jgi:hypothetical protein
MTLKRVCTGLVAISVLASSSAAFAADPIRAGSALPGSEAVTTTHLPMRKLKTMNRKEHLQGDGSGATEGTNWVIPVLGIAAIGGGLAAALSNNDSKPDSP